MCALCYQNCENRENETVIQLFLELRSRYTQDLLRLTDRHLKHIEIELFIEIYFYFETNLRTITSLFLS